MNHMIEVQASSHNIPHAYARTHTACDVYAIHEANHMECVLRRFVVAFLTLEFTLMSFDLSCLTWAYGQSSLKLTIIYLKPNKHPNTIRTRTEVGETKALHQVRNNQVYSILDMLHMYASLSLSLFFIFEVCAIAVICCKLTCYILYSTSL